MIRRLLLITSLLAVAPALGAQRSTVSPLLQCGARAQPAASRGQVVLEVAAALERHASAVDSAWPGFWPATHSYALFPFRQGALVISTDPALGVALQPVMEDLPSALRGRAFFSPTPPGPGALPWVRLDYEVGGARVVAASPWAPMGPYADSTGASLFFLLHESFHAFQLHAFAGDIPTPAGSATSGALHDDSRDHAAPLSVADTSVQARLAAERAALAAAIVAGGFEERRQAIRRYFAERDERLALLPQGYLVGETFGERVEGTATYVAMRGTAEVLGQGAEGAKTAIVAGLDCPYWPERTAEWLFGHWHVYAIGAAKAWLLEATSADWRGSVATGASLDQLLVKLFDLPR